ncbi:MAG: nitrilase-related carbon-nitrogen hydrolase [Syntrophorhabdaceae bacterium]
MKIAGIQFACTSDKDKNLTTAVKLLGVALNEDARIICFQELFDQYWFPKDRNDTAFQLAEDADGETVKLFKSQIQGTDTVIILPLFEKANGSYYNSAVVIEGDRTLGVYRKINVTDIPLWEEKFYFSQGNNGLPVFETKHGKFGIQTSWDNFFQEGSRILAKKGADIIFAPTSCAFKSQQIWQTVISANAITNGVYIMRVNRSGSEEAQDFYGMSFCVNPEGELIGGPTGRADTVFLADVDLEKLKLIRREWPILKEVKADLYRELAGGTL